MPQFVAGFAAFFTGAAVSGAVATLGFLTAVVTFNAALGAIARKLTSKKESDTGQRQPREVTVRATDAYDVFAYGRALVGGVTVYHNGIPDSSGINNRMHHVVKWVGHECSSLALFRLDDRILDPDIGIDWNPVSYTGTGLVENGEFRGLDTASGPTYIRWYLGNQTSADQRLAEQADEWTNEHIGQDQTYGVLEIWQVDENDQTSRVLQKSGGRGPSNIAASVLGKKVYDHRRYALNRDPTFQNPSSYWFTGASSGSILPTSWTTKQGVGGVNDRALSITDTGADSAPWVFSEPIPVNVASKYSLTVRARNAGGDGESNLAVSFWDGNGVNINANSSNASGAWAIGTFHYWSLVSTTWPSAWTEFSLKVGSGEDATIPSCASFMRIGALGPFSMTNATIHQLQDYAVYRGTGSRHLRDVSSTWEYSESPPFCVADYLRDERLGYGKRLRIPVNPSRYARNGDPGFRRIGSITDGVHWRGSSANSGSNSPPDPDIFSLHTALTGAPVGRRALVAVASAGTSASGLDHRIFSDAFAIDPSGFYTISLRARQDGPKAAYLPVAFLDADGHNIDTSSSDAVGWATGTFHYFHANKPLPSVWSHYTIPIGSGTGRSIPTSARFMSVGALCVRSFGTNGDTQQYFQDYWVQVGTSARYFVEPHEQIFWPSVSSAAAYTDAIVATPSGDQVRFACNGAGHTGRGHRQNVRDLLSSFNGRAVYVQSGFWITAGWEEPTKTLNKSDFRKGGMKIRAKADLLDRYNHVRGTFYDPDNEFKRVPFATVTANEYIARDSSQQLFHDVHLPFTNDWHMAQRVAFGILEQGNNQQLVEFQLKHSALDLLPGRVVGINNDIVSWDNHTLRMVDMETDLKKGVKLFAREDHEASYVDPSTGEYSLRSVTEVTSRAPIVPQVSSVTLTPRDGGIQLNWNNPAARSFEWIDVFRRTTNAFSGSTLIKSTRNDEYFDTLQAGQTQFYWFRSRDFAGNVSSIFPGLVSSFSGAGLFPVARDPEYTFLEEFRFQSLSEFQQKWEHLAGSGAVTFIGSGTIGGKVLQSSGFTWWVSRTRIPYDPEALYQMTVRARLTNSVDAARNLFTGFVGYRADGVTPIAVDSTESALTQHFFVRNSQSLDSLDLWAEYTGHVRGHMPWPSSGTVNDNLSGDPKLAARMHDLVRYVSPTFALNHLGGGGTAQFGPAKVRKLIPYRTVTFDPEITAQSNWLVARDITDIGVGSSDQVTVQSITNVNINGEYSVLPISQPFTSKEGDYFIAERFRPEFHPRMPSSGAFYASMRVFVTSRSGGGTVQFWPTLVIYTRSGTAIEGWAQNAVSVSVSSATDFHSNEWIDIGTPIIVASHGDVDPASGPYYLAPGCQIINSAADEALNSSWIAYLNVTPGTN